MPSVSPKQARFMRAVDHGWVPDRVKAPPRSVAHEFVEADKHKKGRRRKHSIADAIGAALSRRRRLDA